MKTIKLFCGLLFLVITNPIFSQTDPNIVLIIADDMGWSQVSTGLTNLNNQSDFYETPTIATLASEGIAFPYGYVNGANCAPTRSALLSGQYASRPHNNIWAVANLNRGDSNSLLVGPSQGLPSGVDEIPASAVTVAETLKTAGYATVHLGKFHVGEDESSNTSNNAATDQGFDTNYGGGTKGAPGTYFASSSAPYTFHANIGPELDVYAAPYTAAESIALSLNGDNTLEGTPKHVTDAMADAAIDWMELNKNTPFFMHFSNFAIHGPYDTGNARPDLVAKYQAKTPSQMGHNSIGQAAIAEGMDRTIARLVDYLKTTDDPRIPGQKLSENTLVYFISDNGGAIGTDDNGPLRGMKGEFYEGGIRSVTFAWSEASWLANKGTVNTTPVVAFDLYPTFAEMAGASLPGGGYDIDGESQWQMLTNGTAMSRQSLFWHFPGYIANGSRDQRPVSIIRKGDYKLIHNYETASYEMYNLITDISEATNLLAGNPDQATLTIANDMSTDLLNHLVNISAPLPTYRSNGQTVPLPYIISISGGSNSADGCQTASGYTAYWDFDTVSGTDDISGNGYNAVVTTGTPTYDTSDFQEGDQSIVFDGATEIQYSNGTFLNVATASRSIAVWIKPDALTGTQEIFDEGGSGNGLALRLNGSTLEAALSNNQGGNTDPNHTISTAYPTDGDWHHVALVFDGASSTMSIYIDGVFANSSVGAYTSLGTHTSNGGIGGVLNGDAFGSGPNDSFFSGKMDAFSVYDTVLTTAQVEDAACFQITNSTAGCQPTSSYEAFWDFDIASNADDASGNGHNPNIVPSGAITYDTVDFKEGDQSVVFDGTEAIQYATNNSSPDTFMNAATSVRSVVAWVKPTGLTGIQDIYDEGGQNIGIAIRLNGATLESVVRDTNTSADILSAAFPNDADWHHVAVVYDGSATSHKLYLDGVEVGTSSSAGASLADHFSYGGIGGKLSGNDSFQNSSDAFFTGKMDAVAMYNVALTLAEVQASACASSQVVADAGPDVTICEGDSTTLTASGGTTYLWNTGATTASITVSPTTTTTYSVTVSDGTTSDNDDVVVTVNALPVADAGADVTIDSGNSTTLTASGGGTYLWSTGETTASIVVSPTSTTTYTVTVTTNGCSDTDDVIVTVNTTGGCTYSVINDEDFESGWGIWNDGGSDARRNANDAAYANGTYCVRLRDDTDTSTTTTDNLDLTAYDEITVDFGYYCRSMDNVNEDFWLQISTDGGSSYTTMEEWNLNDEFVNDQFYTDSVVISGPFTANTRLRFRADASGNQDWVYLDDIIISGCSTSGSSKILPGKETKNEVVSSSFSEIDIKMYPNPFQNEINIQIPGDYKQSQVELFNALGQLIYKKALDGERNISIPARALKSGQYIVHITIDSKVFFKRLLKD
ncbi:hypothetical protein MHTCC0001_17220 [Flavobacteriaceae bacterium MHTCC 0001]